MCLFLSTTLVAFCLKQLPSQSQYPTCLESSLDLLAFSLPRRNF
jgi:hypothetical protein